MKHPEAYAESLTKEQAMDSVLNKTKNTKT